MGTCLGYQHICHCNDHCPIYKLKKKNSPIGLTRYLICFIKTLAASLIMGLVVFLIYYKLGALLPAIKLVQIIILLASVAIGAIVYFVLLIVFRVKELGLIVRKF